MKPSARQPATHCVVFTAFWKSPGVAVCSARPIWALHCLVHFTYKLLSAAENKCSVQCSGGSRAVCQCLGKLVFSEKYIKALSVSGERGSEISADGEHLAEWLSIQKRHGIGQKKTCCIPYNRKILSYIKKAPSKVVFSISFHQLSQIKRASGLFAQFDQMNPVSSELFPILDF